MMAGENCYTCDYLDYDGRYVYPYRCLLNKPERFDWEECQRRIFEQVKCEKYKIGERRQ